MARRLPVRWRLTLWYAALFALVLALSGGVLFFGLRERLNASFDEQLRDQAAVILATVRIEGETPTLQATPGGEQEGEYLLRLLDGNGAILTDNSAALGGVPLDRAAVDAAMAGQMTLALVTTSDGQTLRLVTMPVHRNGEDGPIVGVLQFGLDHGELNEVLDQVGSTLMVVAPLALLAAAAVGYVLAGRALAPVSAITRLAAAISGHDLHARLNLDLPDDELGQLARTFDGMLDRIEDAFERQRRFTGDAAHELRTPLSLLRSRFDQTMARPRTNAEYEETILEAQTDVARLTGLVNTLLTLARADAGQLSLEYAPIDLAESVVAVREQYEPLAEEAGVVLVSDTAPTPLVADEDLLVQVLVNLVDNALKHTPPGGRVVLGCRREGPCVRLWVIDSGAGIPAEHQARVFDRFYRVDPGRSRAVGGAGLGLAICRSIAEAHGGTIGLSSRPGHGARIDLVVPAEPDVSEARCTLTKPDA